MTARTLLLKLLNKEVIAAVALLAATVWLYWNGRYDYPRKDHPCYLWERDLFASNGSWFTHSLTHTRTRLLFAGDRYLFRPGMMAVLALQDIFLRENLLALGVLSILFFAAVVIALYALLRKWCSYWVALLFSLLFASQPIGIEIVMWRHISPYVLTLLFFWGGYLIWRANMKFTGHRTLVVASFTLAMMFHEYVSLAMILLFCWIGVTKLILGRTGLDSSARRLLQALGFALLIYLALNIADYVVHAFGQPLFNPGDKLPKQSPLWSVFINSFTVLVASIRSAFLSYSVGIANPVALWPFGKHLLNVIASSLLGGAIVIALLARFWRLWKVDKVDESWVMAMAALLSVVAITGALAIGRGTLRGMYYVPGAASYYFSITTAYWTVILAYVVFAHQPVRKSLRVMVLCLVAATVLGQSKRLHAESDGYGSESGRALEQAIKRSAGYFDSHPDSCLASRFTAGENGKFVAYRPFTPMASVAEVLPFFLRRYECLERAQSSSPWILKVDPGGDAILIPFVFPPAISSYRGRTEIRPAAGKSPWFQITERASAVVSVLPNQEPLQVSYYHTQIPPEEIWNMGRSSNQWLLWRDRQVVNFID